MKVLVLALVFAAFALPGCGGEENPCEPLVAWVKSIPIYEAREDGAVVEVDGETAVCEDGEPVARP